MIRKPEHYFPQFLAFWSLVLYNTSKQCCGSGWGLIRNFLVWSGTFWSIPELYGLIRIFFGLIRNNKSGAGLSLWLLCTRVLLCTVVVCCLLLGVLVCCCVLLRVRGVGRSPCSYVVWAGIEGEGAGWWQGSHSLYSVGIHGCLLVGGGGGGVL